MSIIKPIIQASKKYSGLGLSSQMKTNEVHIGLDASRNRSGGAIAHIKGLIGGGDPREHGIDFVHLFGHAALLAQIDDQEWLIKHHVEATKGSIIKQLFWQRFRLPLTAKSLGVQLMFNTDAGSVCPMQPSVTLSQDMLSYEPGEMQRYPMFSKSRVRLEVLKIVQLSRLKNSNVALFLTHHAAKVIGSYVEMKRVEIISHGIDQKFLNAANIIQDADLIEPLQILYVSNAAPYKHQWHVVEGVAAARKRTGLDLRLRLVGGGAGTALARLDRAIATHDPDGVFVEKVPFIPNEKIVSELKGADLFVFASSCENMPITLLEAMAIGLPIACSNRGPMPEVLGTLNPYFDPENPETITNAIECLIKSKELRASIAGASIDKAREFTWGRCANSTWELIAGVLGEKIA